MTKTLTARSLSKDGLILRPRYRNGLPPAAIPATETGFDPLRHKKTHAPHSLGLLFHRAAFSAPYDLPVQIEIQIKAAQSDVYYIPRELAHHAEFLQRTIDRQHNKTPTAFTQGVYLQLWQNVGSPAANWHYDIGNPSTTFLVTDKNPAIYAPGFPLRLPQDVSQIFSAGAEPTQFARREYLYQATDFDRLDEHRKNGITTLRFQPYEIAEHDHLTVHKGIPAANRTLLTTGYIDTDQPALSSFTGLQNPMDPDIERPRTAPPAEAAERLAHYLKRAPA